MPITLAQLQAWMIAPEGEHLEFKEAKNNFHFEKLVKYLLQGLKTEGKIQMRGYGRGARWYEVELENPR